MILTGFFLRLPLLSQFPFREDEAIYSFWSIQVWRDPFFLSVWPDKPPLYLWILSLVFKFLGTSELSARWFNIVLSVFTIPVTAMIAHHQWGALASIIAGLTLTLNPFAISFSPTGYTDPLFVLAGMLALLAACYSSSFWAGIWLGIAIMTKQQGLFYVPLIVGILSVTTVRSVKFFAGLGLILLPIIYWDSLRWHVALSPWDMSIRNYGPLYLSPPDQWFNRSQEWASLIWYLTSNHFVWIFMGIALCGLLARRSSRATSMCVTRMSLGRRRLAHRSTIFTDRNREQTASCIKSPTGILLLLVTWIIGFLLVHILTTIQTWDRYLLPLAPLIALLCGWLFWRIGGMIDLSTKATYALHVLLIAFWGGLLCPSAVNSAYGRLPIGGDHGAYTGFREALAEMQQRLSEEQSTSNSAKGTKKKLIVYHRVLGWHYQFYLYSEVKNDLIELRWYPNSVSLVDNARKAPHRPRFLLQPSWSPIRDLAFHANLQQLQLVRHGKYGNFHLFELRNKIEPDCSWCVCRQPFY